MGKLYVSCTLLTILCAHAYSAEFFWWEAENSPRTNMTTEGQYGKNLKPEQSKILSGEKWLNGSVSEGLYAEYDLDVKKAGDYELFARRFWQHGAFRWRIDEGKWFTIAKGQRILDSEIVSPSVPASWTSMGVIQIEPGKHVLRIEMLLNSGYQFEKNFAFDCFVLTDGRFTPKGLSRDVQEKGQFEKPEDLGKHLGRTMEILESSTPKNRKVLNILFYGQSIVANSHISTLIPQYIKQKYPNAIIHTKKLAIGGYEAPRLRKTSWYDLYPEYPDLIIFHDYGGEEDGSFEEMFANIKKYTTAEVLTWTHHMDNFNAGIDRKRDKDSQFRRDLAKKYGYEMAEVREQWKGYLKVNNQIAQDMLTDIIHLNTAGSKLLAGYLEPHFRKNPGASTEWKNRIRSFDLRKANPDVKYTEGSWEITDKGLINKSTAPLTITFTGNKLELMRGLSGNSTGNVKIRIDGKKPSEMRDSFFASRPTIVPGGWWPCINYVKLGDNPVIQKYTVKFSGITNKGKEFKCAITGSSTGDEGNADNNADFTAAKGGFRIASEDINLSSAKCPAEFTAEFEIYSKNKDIIKGLANKRPEIEERCTIFQTLSSGSHTVELIPEKAGAICLEGYTVHKP